MAIRRRTPTQTRSSRCRTDEFEEFLLAGLLGSDCEFGRLRFRRTLDDAHPEFMFEPPEYMKGDWTTHRPMHLVMDRTRGALLLRAIPRTGAENDDLPFHWIECAHRQAVASQRMLRTRLDDRPYWRNRPIVLGVGLVAFQCIDTSKLPRGVPGELVIEGTDSFQEAVGELFDYYTTPATAPVERYAARLVDDLTASPGWIGKFVDRDSLATQYGLTAVCR